MMTHRFLLAASAVVFVGCSSGSAGPATGSPPPPVSFRSDVAPIFAASCATNSTCHGAADGANLYLAASTHDAALTVGRLVNQASREVPSMPYVAPGNPLNSYLMHKLDGDLPSVAACSAGSCGSSMPKDGPTLDEATRDRVRGWITQGAKDD